MATNTLGAYNPAPFYANTALDYLKSRLGLARRINRRYDDERKSFEKGDTIQIRRPSTFTAQTAPSTAQNITTSKVTITLNSHQEVKIEVPDKELAYTQMRLVEEHIAPMATGLAEKIETDLNSLIVKFPHAYIEPSAGTTATIAGILQTKKKLFDVKCPTFDEPNMFLEIGGKESADLNALEAFSQFQGAGTAGVSTQMSGVLGRKFGCEIFETQLRPTVTYADITDFAGTITEPAAVDATSITVGGLGAAEVYKKGTIIKFDVSGHEYAVTADATMSSGAAVVSISPPIRVAEADNAAITIQAGQDNATNHTNFMFHRNCAALAFAPLPDFQEFNGLGASIFTTTDEESGLSVRARIYYVGGSSKIECALDALYGYEPLNLDYACRYEVKTS